MRFLAVTDLHYTDLDFGTDNRRHALSIAKLHDAVQHADGCDFIMNLGDTAEGFDGYRQQEDLLDEVCGVLRGTGLAHYSIIGNHDTRMEKSSFYPHMDMENRYYAFSCGGYRCIVLDACLNDENDPLPKQEIRWDDCVIDPEQLQWLCKELDAAEEPVLVFTHVPFMLETPEEQNPHLIRNRFAVMDLLAQSGKVRAVFSGHYHDGCHGFYAGIPFITFSAMVIGTENAFSVVDVTEEEINVKGFGRQNSIKIPLRN